MKYKLNPILQKLLEEKLKTDISLLLSLTFFIPSTEKLSHSPIELISPLFG